MNRPAFTPCVRCVESELLSLRSLMDDDEVVDEEEEEDDNDEEAEVLA